jgi:hypothetical protein
MAKNTVFGNWLVSRFEYPLHWAKASAHSAGLLVSAAALFGQYGDENIEDFYFQASALVALFLAILLVWTANVLVNRLTKKTNPPAQKGQGNPSHGMSA